MLALFLLYHFQKIQCYHKCQTDRKFLYLGLDRIYFVDDLLKHTTDSASIGILICKERNRVVAEYALRGIDKPIGIAEYELTQSIPEKLKGSLPTIEEIEKELEDKEGK